MPTPCRARSLARPHAALPALVAVLALGGCGSSSSGGSSIRVGNEKAPPASAPTTATTAQSAPPGCQSATAPPPRGAQHLARPTQSLDRARTYIVRLQTNCGDIDIQLDVKRAPRTSASFAYLVRRGFYDNLTFHRVAANFVIQGGDPSGTGQGGPGYQVVEKPPANLQYTPGTVAMAKTASDPDGTSGSQFFIVTGTATSLPPQYALVGRVVAGQSAANAIGALPTNPPHDGAPTSPVVIRRATLTVR